MADEEEYRICDAFVCGDYVLEAGKYRAVVEVTERGDDSIITFCKLFSDPVRVKLLRALSVCELCVCVLLSITSCKPSALSYHLKLLKDAGVVGLRRDKNFLIYSLTPLGYSVLDVLEKINCL
jgi:DNA-binding transcriptional ArsR family regulator